MNVQCSGCGKSYRVDEARLAGKQSVRMQCPACQAIFEVSAPAAAAEPFTEAAAAGSPEPAPAATPSEGPSTTQTVREGDFLSESGKMRMGAPALPEGKRVSLAILSGPQQGDVIVLDQPRMVIGRSEAEIVLDDPEISRRHAVLEIYDERFLVRDLNSTNGTYVGDHKITAEELGNQEEFRVGTSRMMFIVTTPESTPDPGTE